MLRIWTPELLIIGLTTRSLDGQVHRAVRISRQLDMPLETILISAKNQDAIKKFLRVPPQRITHEIAQPILHFRTGFRLYLGLTFKDVLQMRRNPFRDFHRLAGQDVNVPFDTLITGTPTEQALVEFCRSVNLINESSQVLSDAIDLMSSERDRGWEYRKAIQRGSLS
jgi:hypothetical protein